MIWGVIFAPGFTVSLTEWNFASLVVAIALLLIDGVTDGILSLPLTLAALARTLASPT